MDIAGFDLIQFFGRIP